MGIFESNAVLAQQRAAQKDLAGALAAITVAAGEARKALLFRARLLSALGQPAEALDEVVRLDRPGMSSEFLEFRAELETRLDLFDAAIGTLGRALEAGGDAGVLLARRGDLYRTIGEFGRAVDDFEGAIARRPTDGELYRLRGELTRTDPGDDTLARLRRACAEVHPDSRDAVHLGFALAKALDETGDFAGAADALRRANAGMRARHPYDIATRLNLVRAAREAFADVTPQALPTRPANEFAPIFITGMPRSGTTLIEQILSAHPDVFGAGETSLFSTAAVEILGAPDAPPPEGLHLSPEALTRLGALYAERMVARFGPAPRHTDKSFQTLLFAGPALAALPQARMIVVRRDPRANALSLYRHVFREGKQLFSYDLDDIRAYQLGVDELVEFWSERLPERFHVIDYEDVVTDPDRAIPALLETVGLPFHPACLAPEDSTRPVKTLSAVAVRSPINREPLDAWKPYAELLGLEAHGS